MGTVSTHTERKLTRLLDQHKPGTVYLASWLESLGISRDLQKRYRGSGWLESIGPGAMKRPVDKVTWQGGLYALQTQAKILIHAGAITALSLQGYAHYLRLGTAKVYLFTAPKTPLPAWFRRRDWGASIRHVQSSILPSTIGLTDHNEKNFAIRVSSPERAMLECLHLTPDELDMVECFQTMEGLTNLRPKVVQELLQKCSSVKAKRLFLFLAEQSGHQWLSRVDLAKISLGTGHRRLSTEGVYVAKYQITVPKALVAQ